MRNQDQWIHGDLTMLRSAAIFVILAAALAACDRGDPPSPPPPAPPSVAQAAARDTGRLEPIGRDSTDRCRWEDPAPRAHVGDEDWLAKWDSASMSRGVPLRCALREGGPVVRVVVGGEYSIPMGVHVYSPPDARKALQMLALDNDERAGARSNLLVGEDLNDDGWTDLRVQTWSGSAGVTHDVFMWNPRRGRFEQDSVFPRGTNIYTLDDVPCLRASSRSGAGHFSGGEFCWSRGAWHLVGTYQVDGLDGSEPGQDLSVRELEWRDGDRVLRRVVDTLPSDSARDIPDFHRSPSVRARLRGDRG